MEHKLPELLYSKDALAPYMSLEEIILNAGDKIYDNAAQAWNHTFFWQCLSPNGGGSPNGGNY